MVGEMRVVRIVAVTCTNSIRIGQRELQLQEVQTELKTEDFALPRTCDESTTTRLETKCGGATTERR